MSAEFVLRQRFWHSLNAVFLTIATAMLALILVVGRAGWLPIVVVGVVLAVLWWAGVRDVRVSSITVTVTQVESRYLFGARSVARSEVMAIDAHPGQHNLWGQRGIVLTLRPVWSRAELQQLARELGVSVCFEFSPQCPRERRR